MISMLPQFTPLSTAGGTAPGPSGGMAANLFATMNRAGSGVNAAVAANRIFVPPAGSAVMPGGALPSLPQPMMSLPIGVGPAIQSFGPALVSPPTGYTPTPGGCPQGQYMTMDCNGNPLCVPIGMSPPQCSQPAVQPTSIPYYSPGQLAQTGSSYPVGPSAGDYGIPQTSPSDYGYDNGQTADDSATMSALMNPGTGAAMPQTASDYGIPQTSSADGGGVDWNALANAGAGPNAGMPPMTTDESPDQQSARMAALMSSAGAPGVKGKGAGGAAGAAAPSSGLGVAAAGAGAGFFVGGPLGAAVGGVLGFFLGKGGSSAPAPTPPPSHPPPFPGAADLSTQSAVPPGFYAPNAGAQPNYPPPGSVPPGFYAPNAGGPAAPAGPTPIPTGFYVPGATMGPSNAPPPGFPTPTAYQGGHFGRGYRGYRR